MAALTAVPLPILAGKPDQNLGRFIDLFPNRSVNFYIKKWGARIEPGQLDDLLKFIRTSLSAVDHAPKRGRGIRAIIGEFSPTGDIGRLAQRELLALLEVDKDALTKARFTMAINNFTYLFNFYIHSKRSRLFQGRLQVVTKGPNTRMKFYPKAWARPDIQTLLLEYVPYNTPEELRLYIDNRLFFHHSLLNLRQEITPIMTPEHERTLSMTLRVHEISDTIEGSPYSEVTTILRGIAEDYAKYNNDPYDGDFHRAFETSFWNLKRVIGAVTCRDFLDSFLKPLRH